MKKSFVVYIASIFLASQSSANDQCEHASSQNPMSTNTSTGGLGGTGIKPSKTLPPIIADGDTGIVGVITGFASICINNIEVQYDASTQVTFNGNPSTLGDLQVGHTVVMKAQMIDGQLHARSIGKFNAVVGPIDRYDKNNRVLYVMDQPVQLDKVTIPHTQVLTPGTNIRVSGQRLNSGNIMATKIETAISSKYQSTIGQIENIHENKVLLNGGTSVHINNSKLVSTLKPGDTLRVEGQWQGKVLEAHHIEKDPIKHVLDHTREIIYQGNLPSHDGQQVILIDGSPVSTKDISKELNVNSDDHSVKVKMHKSDKGHWSPEKIESIHEYNEEKSGNNHDLKNRDKNNLENESDFKNENKDEKDNQDYKERHGKTIENDFNNENEKHMDKNIEDNIRHEIKEIEHHSGHDRDHDFRENNDSKHDSRDRFYDKSDRDDRNSHSHGSNN